MPIFEVNGRSSTTSMKTVSCRSRRSGTRTWRAISRLSEGVEELTENSLEGDQLSAELLSAVRHRAHDPQAVQGDGIQAERDLQDVPVRPGQGRLQAGRPAETDRLRLARGRRTRAEGKEAIAEAVVRGACCAPIRSQTAAVSGGGAGPVPQPGGHVPSGRRSRILLDELLLGMDHGRVAAALDSIMQIRAVQDVPPGRALEFLFQLKDILRDQQPARSWSCSNARIDEMALMAFDLYMKYRERTLRGAGERGHAAASSCWNAGCSRAKPRPGRSEVSSETAACRTVRGGCDGARGGRRKPRRPGLQPLFAIALPYARVGDLSGWVDLARGPLVAVARARSAFRRSAASRNRCPGSSPAGSKARTPRWA